MTRFARGAVALLLSSVWLAASCQDDSVIRVCVCVWRGLVMGVIGWRRPCAR
mgnify:CR=1 FL=1